MKDLLKLMLIPQDKANHFIKSNVKPLPLGGGCK